MLVRGHALVDEIMLFEKNKGVKGFLELRRQLREREFDLVLDLQVYFKANIITSFINSGVKLGFDFARARDLNWLFTTHKISPHPMQHVQDQYLEFCDWLGAPTAPVTWGLGPWSDEEKAWQKKFYSRLDRPVVPIVVATSKLQKNWLPERWADVCDALYSDFGLQPILVGGRSLIEVECERIIMERAKRPPVSALGNGGLRGLVGILDGAALVISLDTGPLHITVALDRPVPFCTEQPSDQRDASEHRNPVAEGFGLLADQSAHPDGGTAGHRDFGFDFTPVEERKPRYNVAVSKHLSDTILIVGVRGIGRSQLKTLPAKQLSDPWIDFHLDNIAFNRRCHGHFHAQDFLFEILIFYVHHCALRCARFVRFWIEVPFANRDDSRLTAERRHTRCRKNIDSG
jgi:hypothetical protein